MEDTTDNIPPICLDIKTIIQQINMETTTDNNLLTQSPTIKIPTTTIVMVSTLISVKIQSTILIIMTTIIMTETEIIKGIIKDINREIINKGNPNVKKDQTIYPSKKAGPSGYLNKKLSTSL
jgi:hypothetical protein